MSAHTFSVSLSVGGSDGWALWDRRLQTYAVVLRLFDPGPHAPLPRHPGGGQVPPVSRIGTRPFEFPTPDALVHALGARGLAVGSPARDAIDTLACSVEAAVGSPRLVGVIDRVGTHRLFCVSTDGDAVELLPQFAHPDHRFVWGRRGSGALSTAATVVRWALGAVAPTELDTAALALMVEFLGEVEDGFELEPSALCAWYLADEPLSATSGPTDRRTLRRLLGPGAPRTPSVSSAAATPAGSGRSGLDRHLEVVEPIADP